ncbi:MAG: hypothetical protein K6G12_01815 [Lachnospiraceae bacterium]|nr:hypothetical protein [Lachnospiraceae bacterium]
MKIKCDYCDNTYEDTLPQCPYCEAPNPAHKQVKGAPKTIEELKQWYADRNLPPYETTRFFIGEDHQGPQAFGIYKDPRNDQFIVYKNKGDGSRAIRYQGDDEEYAVNELYQKLKDEIVHQKANQKNKQKGGSSRSSRGLATDKISLAIFAAVLGGSIALSALSHQHDGYYNYNNTVYYNYEDNWYYYDTDYDDWFTTNYSDPGVSTITESYDDYYMSENWTTDMNATDWDDTSYYEETHSSSDSDSDSDWDWDSGSSWDSGGTDWDSDW